MDTGSPGVISKTTPHSLELTGSFARRNGNRYFLPASCIPYHHLCQTTHRCSYKDNLTIVTTHPFASKIFRRGWKASTTSSKCIWDRLVHSALPLKWLHIKTTHVAKGIKQKKEKKIGDTKLQLAIVKEVLLQLEATQEHRSLTVLELDLCRRLKAHGTGLAAIEKTRIRQRSRLTYIRCGDANTKFFHIRASAHRRKNYIHCLHTDDRIAVAHKEKEKVIADYFKNHIGSVVPRSSTINWQSLGYTPHDLSDLEAPCSLQEVQDTINSMPSDKAQGPDGFTGAFFKAC